MSARLARLCALALLAGLAACTSLPPAPDLVFVVMGDNRGGDDSGEQPAAFHDLVLEVAALRPALVWNTGDMIYGRTTDLARARMQWDRYRAAIAPLRMPVHHVPGNHDIWDGASGRLYRELWGPTHYVVDRGPARFIALDTETEPHRVDPAQRAWLREVLAASAGRRVFIILHQPLFPAASHVATSLDAHPPDRDALHGLLVEHRDRIAAVFAGHEHLFRHERRDGIDYYTTGGGGADLHLPPERGGFHHLLLVRLTGSDAQVEVRRTGCARPHAGRARRVRPGEVLEPWEGGAAWSTWDYTVACQRSEAVASEGRASLRLDVDFARCGWPVLYTGIPWRPGPTPAAWSLDVYVPPGAPPNLAVTPVADAAASHEAPAVKLRPGWNRVRAAPSEAWLPGGEEAALRGLQWIVTGGTTAWCGSVWFDRLMMEERDGGSLLLEGWERPLVWMAWDESSHVTFPTSGIVRIAFDPASCRDPMLIGRAGPPLNFDGVDGVAVDVVARRSVAAVALVVRSADAEFVSPPVALGPDAGRVSVSFDGGWLPAAARAQVEQLAWRLRPAEAGGPGELALGPMRALP